MDGDYEESVLSIIRGGEGCDEEYSSISEVKEHLNEADLAEEKFDNGWVMWRANERYEQQQLHHKIKTLLKHFASKYSFGHLSLVQFWGVVKEEGRHHYLSTSNYPFSFHKFLKKGISWYRKICMDREAAEAEQLGGVGRAYRHKHPESTPDLRLYSISEFPLRDEAARCGFRAYMALPLFDLHTNKSYGVLELLSPSSLMETHLLYTLDQELQSVGLRSTHINFIPISRDTNKMPDKDEEPLDSEIREILELAIKAAPQLSLAQVWVPCKQCGNPSTNLCCMERSSFITAQNKRVNSCRCIDDDMFEYLQACEFHNLHVDLFSSFCRNLCDLSISKNPLAHYAQKARLSRCFQICLQSSVNNNNHLYVIEFYLQPKSRVDSSLNLLLRIMEMKLKSFQFVLLGGQLEEEFMVQSNAIECEEIEMLKVMNSYMEMFSELNFTNYLETIDLCCSRPSSKTSIEGWIFRQPAGEGLFENDFNSHELLMIEEKIEHFMKKIATKFNGRYRLVQFWAPKMVEDRCYLQTSDQPYAVGCLAKGLASFRKECTKHHYFVDDEAKEEELGPPGRVFKNGYPEVIHDLSFCSAKEFSIRNYAVHCGFEDYFVLPVFDEHKHNCVGVLEFLGFHSFQRGDIQRALETAKLHSIHIDYCPTLLSASDYDDPSNINSGKIGAMTELQAAVHWFTKIPQCYIVNVWAPNGECNVSKSRCMKQELFTSIPPLVDRIHAEPRIGMLGMLLESESKSCFCRNICEFGIADQPLTYHERAERCNACFAICLQSSYTGDFLYVVEFFLYQGPATYEYICCFLNFLLPMMKKLLKSFKIASGKQLGEELVVEVIEFSESDQLTSSKSEQIGVFPIKFKRVLYGQKEHQYSGDDQQVQPNLEVRQRKQRNADASKGKRKTSRLHLSLEDLKPHFGKKLKDVAKELGVGRSTIKRTCRDYGINRWPCKQEHARNPSLFDRESARDSLQDMDPSSSSSLQLQETSIHHNVTHTNREITQCVIVQEEAEKVMIRVKYEEDTIKFELCLSLGVSKLFEEVVKRLNLEMGSFKLKYVDEDNEVILIACDDDLQLCAKSQSATGKTCIQLFVPK